MPTWSPDGQRIAFYIGAADAAGDVSTSLGIVSSYRGRMKHVLENYDPWEPDWSPDASRIVFSDGLVEIRVWNPSDVSRGARVGERETELGPARIETVRFTVLPR